MTITPLGAPIPPGTLKAAQFIMRKRPDLIGRRFYFKFGHVMVLRTNPIDARNARTHTTYRVTDAGNDIYHVTIWHKDINWQAEGRRGISYPFTITGV